MKGSYGAVRFFDEYPILWVVFLFLLLVFIVGPALARRLSRTKGQHVRLKALDVQKQQLLASVGTETYYQEADAYLTLLDPNSELPDRAEIAALIQTAHMVDTLFHYNSVDWFVAHAHDGEFEEIADGLRALSLKDMVGPVYDASEYRTWAEKVTTPDETEALFEASDAIRADFDSRGGAERVRNAVYARLKPRIDEIIAV